MDCRRFRTRYASCNFPFSCAVNSALVILQVRGLPCAHNFHVECIDEWLRLNVKCPRCRCSVFPNLDLSALSNIRSDTERSSSTVVTTTRYVRSQPSSQSYLLRLQGLLRPIRAETGGPSTDATPDLETAENGGVTAENREQTADEAASSVGHVPVTHLSPPQR